MKKPFNIAIEESLRAAARELPRGVASKVCAQALKEACKKLNFDKLSDEVWQDLEEAAKKYKEWKQK